MDTEIPDFNHENKKSSAKLDYNSYILKDNFTIRSLISRIVSGCSEDNLECISLKIYNYVRNDILLSDKGLNGASPLKILTNRAGDKADKSVLLASFLENAGISTYIKDSENDLSVYVYGLKPRSLHREIIKELHHLPLAARDVTLKKGGSWAVRLNFEENSMSVDISAKSSLPFDMFLFPDETEAKFYLKDRNGRFLNECSFKGTKNVEISCLAPKGSMLMFISTEGDADFSGHVYKGGVLLGDISVLEINGKSAIPFNPTLASDLAFPGMN